MNRLDTPPWLVTEEHAYLSHKPLHEVYQEVRILEIREHTEVDTKTQDDQQLLPPTTLHHFHNTSDKEVRRGCKDQQTKPQPATLIIELEREHRNVDNAC